MGSEGYGDSESILTKLSKESLLWPSSEYDRQVDRLRSAIGRLVYIVEGRFDPPSPSVIANGQCYELLDLIDFKRPNPARRIYPHVLLLDDGRGLNLGHVLRVSIDSAFSPTAEQCLFEDKKLTQVLLFRERRLNRQYIRDVSHAQLAGLLGHSVSKPTLEE